MLKRFKIDNYMLMLIGMVVLGAIVPASGFFAEVLGYVTIAAIGLLFFLYGARMNATQVLAGLTNWRLQGLSVVITYVVFPVMGLGVAWVSRPFVGNELALGILFLSVLPSTINSSIALTGMAGGNVSGGDMLGHVIEPAGCIPDARLGSDIIAFRRIECVAGRSFENRTANPVTIRSGAMLAAVDFGVCNTQQILDHRR